jgi:hypothetical protein
MLKRIQKIFSFKQFIQALVTILLGTIAFAFAMKAWMETKQEPMPVKKSQGVDVILIDSGEVKIVKAQRHTLAAMVAKIDCV